jgi:hypothetical protein
VQIHQTFFDDDPGNMFTQQVTRRISLEIENSRAGDPATHLVTAERAVDFSDGAAADPMALQKARDALMILVGGRLYSL